MRVYARAYVCVRVCVCVLKRKISTNSRYNSKSKTQVSLSHLMTITYLQIHSFKKYYLSNANNFHLLKKISKTIIKFQLIHLLTIYFQESQRCFNYFFLIFLFYFKLFNLVKQFQVEQFSFG